jgi:hypothetical protein
MSPRGLFDRASLGRNRLFLGLPVLAGALIDYAGEVSNFRTLSASFALVRLGVRIHDSRRSTTDKLTSQR